MNEYIFSNIVAHIIVFQLILILISISNIKLIRKSGQSKDIKKYPKVSVLIPARNEEANIIKCVQSVLHNDYPEFEVIVLDDESSDNTYSVVHNIARKTANLKLLTGRPTPKNSSGKNWACHQLAMAATGEIFFFTDADTVHQPQSIAKVVVTLIQEDVDLVSGFPHQVLGSLGEKLLVPFFGWAALTFYPLKLAYRFDYPVFSLANGQLMVFKKEAYWKIGGHKGIMAEVVDDLSLAKKINEMGMRFRITEVVSLISCRMYANGKDAMNGFTKNLFAVFNYRIIPFLFTFSWLVIMFIHPIFLLVISSNRSSLIVNSVKPLISVILSLVLWIVPFSFLNIPLYIGIFFPIVVLAVFIAALRSLYFSLKNQQIWKGRNISNHRWTWI